MFLLDFLFMRARHVEVTDTDIGTHAPVVAAVDFVLAVVFELDSLAVATHEMVALASYSYSPGGTDAHRLQRVLREHLYFSALILWLQQRGNHQPACCIPRSLR